jgi:hypothetical protein
MQCNVPGDRTNSCVSPLTRTDDKPLVDFTFSIFKSVPSPNKSLIYFIHSLQCHRYTLGGDMVYLFVIYFHARHAQ